MNLKEWRNTFLEKNERYQLRGDSYDGAPLYRYKMSAEEYEQLKVCLQTNLTIYKRTFTLEEISREFHEFSVLFVLYAANWWQREGSVMNWEPIFSSIGLNSFELNSNARTEMIKRGFRYWKLVISDGGKKYIGNIAVQGGLPMKLIASDNNGNLNRLLKRALKDVINLTFPDKYNIVMLIEANQEDLPESYRKHEVFELIAEIIETFIRIKNSANLHVSNDPIQQLDLHNPNWRDSFPLPMDDDNAKGILERFVIDGARIQPEQQNFIFKLARTIKFLEDGFQINAKVILPVQSEDEETIKRNFGIEQEFLSRLMRLEIFNQNESMQVSISRLAGQNKYRFNFVNHEFRNALSTYSATLKSDKYSKNLMLENADELDEDSPWIFDAEELNEFKFIKIGAGEFKSSQLYVVVNEQFQPNLNLNCKGKMFTNSKLVCYEVNCDTIFQNEFGESFEIKPNAIGVIQEDYVFRGNRLWDIFDQPSIAFKGIPKVFKIYTTNSILTPVNALCKNLDQKPLKTITTFGTIHIAVKEGNHQTWASKIVVLPSNAVYKITSGQDANQGNIKLIDWGISNLKCLTDKVEISAKKVDNLMTIDCKYIGQSVPEEYIHLELFWDNNPKSAKIKLPFPSAGIIAFDGLNQRLNHQNTISLKDLYGIRIVSLLTQNNYINIKLKVLNNNGINVNPYLMRIKRDMLESRIVIRLIDFKDQIRDLLYSINTLNVKVEFKVGVPGVQQDFKLEITKYDLEMEHTNQSANFNISQMQLENISKEKIDSCEMIACRIDDIDEIVLLRQSLSEGVTTGVWKFPLEEQSQGCWIVCPSPKSSIQFKPLMLPLGDAFEFEPENSENINLLEAQKITNNDSRFDAINIAIKAMIQNFHHHDWRHAEYLAKHLGHLDLTSLDIWRVFAKNQYAMAAIALRNGNLPDQFISRFNDELPFMWEFVSIDAWLDAAFNLKKQLLQEYGDNEVFAEEFFKLCLNKKLDDLLAQNPSLKVIFEFVRFKNKLEVSQDFCLLVNHPQIFESTQTKNLFYRDDSELQKLLQRDAQWPQSFRTELAILKSSHQILFPKLDYNDRESVINMPIALAIFILKYDPSWYIDKPNYSWIEKESNYLGIKSVKFFDYDWFLNAFDITVARGIILGYVQLLD